jgi:uncharacterized membrane protein (UPF0127 family)
MKSKNYYIFILIPIIFLCTKSFTKDQNNGVNNHTVRLVINNYKIIAEVADSEKSRTLGLMFRKSINTNQGMLFEYKNTKTHCMWMKNTIIPLSVAFINKNHEIVDIQSMKPFTKTPHCSILPSKYALEMKSGWFKKNNITPGQKVYGLSN